jgi:hypothetical protein
MDELAPVIGKTRWVYFVNTSLDTIINCSPDELLREGKTILAKSACLASLLLAGYGVYWLINKIDEATKPHPECVSEQ